MTDFRVAQGIARRAVTRIGRGEGSDEDHVVVEEPLEIRVAGDPVATTMRTPGYDERLALGFLFAEGIVTSVDDVGSIAHCGHVGEEGFGNVIDVLPAPGIALAPERVRGAKRGTLTTSACGVCGRVTIDDLASRLVPLDDDTTISTSLASSLVARLRDVQPLFARTGGNHGAAIFSKDGALLAAHEDVGRHNAVDKVVGEIVAARAIAEGNVLVVSGRASFEIVQKAWAARVPIVLAVSAPSSLAIDLATRAGITLAGFVRAGAMNVYTNPSRITGSRAFSR